MTLSIRPSCFIFLLLTLLIVAMKPQPASKPTALRKAHGMTADEAIAMKDQRIERTFRSAYETAINR
ncbi:MAG: hypothetical protein LC130_23340 [Bryobacterales bacterium]|nr:hypothetical protein [Bryobacterales bacterium]